MRKCWYPAFSPFPTKFSTLPNPNFNFSFTFILSSAKAFNLDKSKILFFGKALILLFISQTDSINSASTLDDSEAQLAVQSLQEELITVRLKEAENCATIKTLHHKIEDLEQVSYQVSIIVI